MKKWILLTALTLAAGCGGVKPPIQGRNDPYAVPQVEYTDSGLRDKTAIGQIKVTNTNGIIYVTIPIRATTNDSYYIDWKITFFDANGAPMSNTGWAHHMLYANTFEYLTGNSLSPGAKDFQIDLRYAQ